DVPLAAADLLAAVVAALAPHLGGLDTLAVDVGHPRRLVPAGLAADLAAEGIDDPLPGAVLLPGLQVVEGGALGGQVVRQHVPLAAGAGLVQQRVDDLAEVHRAGPAAGPGGGQQGLEKGPLVVGQVRGVGLPHGRASLRTWGRDNSFTKTRLRRAALPG